MPDSPRPAIAFPAFQTPAGLTPQGDREHRSDYAETQGQAQELSLRTNGIWMDLPYSPGRYWGEGSMWIVEKKDITVARYKRTGNELRLSIALLGTMVTPAILAYISFPERLVTREYATTVWRGSQGPQFAVIAQAVKGQNYMSLLRFDVQNWSGLFQVGGQFTIEVEER